MHMLRTNELMSKLDEAEVCQEGKCQTAHAHHAGFLKGSPTAEEDVQKS